MIPHSRPIKRRIKQVIKGYTERLGLEILGSLWKLSKVIIVPDFPPPFTIAKANIVPSYQYIKKLKLVGPIIPKYPKDFPPSEEIKRRMGLDDRPLIFAAMSGTLAEKKYISDLLLTIFTEFPDSYNVVLSKGYPDDYFAETKKINSKRLRVYNWVDDRYLYLKACDLLITRGGHNTVSEAIYYGKPMLIIPTPAHSEHQGIAESLSKMGLAISLQQHSLSKDTLLAALKEALESSIISLRIEEASRYASQFNAVESIYKIVCDLLSRSYD